MKLHINSISLEYSDDFKKLVDEGIYVGIAIDNVRPLGPYSNYARNIHEMTRNYALNFEIIKTKKLEQLTWLYLFLLVLK